MLVYLCAILYIFNGCDDRQFSLVVRIGGVPGDAPMPCPGDSSNIFGLIFGPWTGMVRGPSWARQSEPRGPRINAGEQHRARAHDEELSLTPARRSLSILVALTLPPYRGLPVP
jgi:hypothetical protein